MLPNRPWSIPQTTWERMNPTQRLSYVLETIRRNGEMMKELIDIAKELAPAHKAYEAEMKAKEADGNPLE